MAHEYVSRQALDLQGASKAMLIGRIEELTDQLAEMASELWFYQGIISNPTLQGNAKAVMIGSHLALAKARDKDDMPMVDGRRRTYRQDVAEYSGCSVDAVSLQWKKLANSQLLDKKTDAKFEDGEFGKAVMLAIPQQVYLNPSGVKVASEALAGGARVPQCPECKGFDIKVVTRKSFICQNTACGCVGTEWSEQEIFMVSEEQAALEMQTAKEEEAAKSAGSIAEEEARQLIEWIKSHGGNIRLAGAGETPFAVMFLPDEITLPTYNKVRIKFKALQPIIERLIAEGKNHA